MISDTNVKKLLTEAEISLSRVLVTLTSAEPGALAASERQLVDMVELFGRIQHSVRMEPFMPIRESLLAIRTMLGQGLKLSLFALGTVGRQMESRSLCPAVSASILCVEG